MKEFENFINSSKIEEEYHEKIFNDNLFEKFFSKINLKDFEKLKNEIYWLSLLIFRCSTTNYLDNINKDINTEKSTMTLNINNLIIFHPFGNIASEICKHFYNNYVYISSISTLCRQLIEQICLIKEIEKEKIEDFKIIEASIDSYNMHLGANSITSNNLNIQNVGLLKVFDKKTSYGSLAQKYKYGFMYNFFSGDIHTQSQIEKLLPMYYSKKYYETYLKCVLSLLKDCLLILKKYDKNKLVIDLSKLNIINFIEIKSNKKGKK